MLKSTQVPSRICNAVISLLQEYYPTLTEDTLLRALNHFQELSPLSNPSATIKRKLTRNECAEILGVSLNTVNRYVKAGRLKTINFSSRLVRIDPESVQKLLDRGINNDDEQEEA